MKQKILVLLLILVLVFSLGACGGSTSDEKITANFADAGWDSIKFHNAVAMFIGETAYNIEGTEMSGTTPVTYATMLTGDIDVYMEVWSLNIDTYDEDLADGKFQELSLNFGDNAQGLYVPRYVIEGDTERGIEAVAPDLVTVEDLKKYSDIFVDPEDSSKGRIYGSISGWAADVALRAKYEYMGLDEYYNYLDPGSDAALSASIVSAYEKGEPIVAYYWEPTWITGKYDLVLLEDEPYTNDDDFIAGKTAFPSVPVTVCVSNDFADKAPEYCEFLSNYETSSALTAEALSYIQDTDASMQEAAIWFLTEHDELIDQWLPADKAELIRDALNQ